MVRSQLFTKIISKINKNYINFCTLNRNNIINNIDISDLVKNEEGLVEVTNLVPKEKKIIRRYYGNFYEKNVQKFFFENYFVENKKFFLYTIKHILFNFYKINNYFKNNKTKKPNNFGLIYHKYLNYFNFKKNNLNSFELVNLKSYFFFLLNIKKKKPFINVSIKDKTKLAISTGFILKKLKINEKKSKKNIKTLFLILKIIIADLNKNLKNYKKVILNIKGSKKRLFQIMNFLKKKFKFNKIIFIYTPNFYQNSIKFKKIKSIKRRLRKKLIKK